MSQRRTHEPPEHAELLSKLSFAASVLRAAVRDQRHEGELAEWFRVEFVLEVATLLEQAYAVIEPADPPASPWSWLLCKKRPHAGEGHLHDADDDSPFDVDGVLYCGRCHFMCDRSGQCENHRALALAAASPSPVEGRA